MCIRPVIIKRMGNAVPFNFKRKNKVVTKKLKKPKPWEHTEPITREQLQQMREEFWDTAPYYGGHREIWDALQSAVKADLKFAQVIVDSAGIIFPGRDLSVCYDERGSKYELPKYVLSDPTNLIRNS